MGMKKLKIHFTAILPPVLMLALAAGFVFFGDVTAQGAKNGASLCTSVIIPSVFPFMCLCLLLSESGGDRLFSKLLPHISKLLFGRLSGFSYIFFFSLLGGYPAAAAMLSPLLKQQKISLQISRRLLLFCFCPTPAFCITAVGRGMYQSESIGLVLYASCVISALASGMAVCRIKKPVVNSPSVPFKRPDPSALFVSSIENASKSCLTICATVIFTCSFLALLKELIKYPAISEILTCLFETASAADFSAKNLPVFVTAAVLSFGGVSTFFQTAALSGRAFPNVWIFLLLRFSTAALSAGICKGLMSVFKMSVPAISNGSGGVLSASLSCSPIPAALLVLCSVFLVFCSYFPQKSDFR